MPFLFVKFLHIGAMFVATALAVGPAVMLYLVARNGETTSIRRAFGFAAPLFRAAGISYGLGILFGAVAALTGAIDLADGWLLTAYVLVAVLIVTNLGFERWTRRIDAAAGDHRLLERTVQERAPLYSVTAMVLLTLAIVFVMVVKPSVLG